ncbi:MAG: hypothetical protein QM256_01655, partial [Pseudomonadota bacterium]|nr:hypothetical protein [Pseudomonadota bacterium]
MPIREIDYDPFAEQYVREQELAKKRNILEIDYDPFAGTEEEHPAAAPSKREALQPPASKVGTLGGVASALGQGLAEGVTTAIPEMVGESLEFVGSYLPGQAVESIGKDLKEWAEAKGKSLYGEPKKREGLERWVYEGSKMLAPSVIPAGVVGTGVRILTGVGKLVKAGKAAELAGDVVRAKEYYDAATKAAKLSNNVASASTAGLFGTAQAQSTRDNAELQAKKLEAAGDFEGARQARESGQGWAPIASGAIEAGGEFFGTKYLGKLFRLDEAGVAKRGAKQLVSDFLKTLGVEVGTEMGQQGGEAYVEKVSGIRPEADPLAEALDVIGPTAFMIILTGGAAGAVNTMRRPDDAVDLLEDEKTKDQPDITETIRQAIGEQKKAEAQVKPRPSTAKEAAETFFGKEAVENERAIESLRRRGLYVPEDQPAAPSAEESARVFEAEQARQQGEAVRAATPPARVVAPIGPELGKRIPSVGEMAGGALPAAAPTARAEEELPLFQPESEIERIDQAGNEAATSPLNDRPQPTEAQKDAGNYAKGHVKLHGLDISIENPRGSERAGTDKAGKPWSVVMEHPYGYI